MNCNPNTPYASDFQSVLNYLIRENQVRTGSSSDLQEQQLDLSQLVGRIQELVKEAKTDGRIDKAEHRSISRKIGILKQIASELDERLKGEVL